MTGTPTPSLGIPPELTAQLETSLQEVRDAAAAYRGGRPVAPLGPLASSPILAAGAAGSATPPTTLPFPQAPAPNAAPPPRPSFLKPFWVWGPQDDMPPTERLSTDGLARLAYETSAEPDACGGPVWKRASLPFSPGAEAVLAQHIGSVSAVNDLLTVLRTLAVENVSADYAQALARNILTKLKVPLYGPRLKVPAEKPRPTPAPMPPDGSPVEGNVVAIQHAGCALMVITSDHLPKFGDTLTQEREGAPAFRGEVIRASAKDGGAFDLIVKVIDGAPTPGPLSVRRPVPEPSADKQKTELADPAARAVMSSPAPAGTPAAHAPGDPK